MKHVLGRSVTRLASGIRFGVLLTLNYCWYF